jgi:hypothetical protein
VALIGELPNTEAASRGIHLPTHQTVFAAAREIVAADYLTVHPGMSADILRRALERANIGAQGKDPILAEAMHRIIREVLIPSLPLLTLARVLVDAGVSVALIGSWPGLSGERIRCVPFDTYTTRDWDDVAVLAHLAPEGAVSPLSWDAVTAGVPVISPEHASDKHFGSITELLKPDIEFAHPRPAHYLTTIKSLLGDTARRAKVSSAARERLSELAANS